MTKEFTIERIMLDKKNVITNNHFHIIENRDYIFKDLIEKKEFLLKPMVCEDMNIRCKKCFFSRYILNGDKCHIGCIDYFNRINYFFIKKGVNIWN